MTAVLLVGFIVLMLGRSAQVAWRHWRQGYSVLERPDVFQEDEV